MKRLFNRLHKIERAKRGGFCRPADLSIGELDLPPQICASVFVAGAGGTVNDLHLGVGVVGENPIVQDTGRRTEVQTANDGGLHPDL